MTSRQRRFPKPKFEGWKIASLSAALYLFEVIGCVVSLVLIGSGGAHFPPTYSSIITCAIASFVSGTFLFCLLFSINETEPEEWVFWETLYICSFSFFSLVNTITMLYGSIRYNNTSWWFATVICTLVSISFFIHLTYLVKKYLSQLKSSIYYGSKNVKIVRFNRS